ncbi:MAG: Asp-tRNA(Asn)/Glu-tRNA(Gln) amidotransferase subunit GatB, partial [Bacteroidota bacterium]
EISRSNIFDRKNYFYPDLPKGYQLTQDRTPICLGGYVTVTPVDGEVRDIVMNRIHVEEDAGKSIHLDGENDSLIDFNRAGVPLIEIVTEPVIKTSAEAFSFLAEIRKMVRYLDICDGNMEEGSLRCDANISIRLKGDQNLEKKVEVKNMNSMRNVQRAIDHEFERQVMELEKGNEIVSETRTFDATAGTTAGMRTKEELNDYRYFPDPDLSPLHVSEDWLNQIKANMPVLPRALYLKYTSNYQLPELDAQVLTETKEMAHYFEAFAEKIGNYKQASNWLMGPVKSYLNEQSIEISLFPLQVDRFSELIGLVNSNKVSHTAASQTLFKSLIENPDKTASQLAEELNLLQNSDSDHLGELIDAIIVDFPDKVKAFKNGKKGLMGMFMGELMKRSKGKADPKVATELLKEKLS